MQDIQSNLTPEEKELFATLIDVINSQSPSTTIRVAGGWVRDKLLGVPSDDIDIMVDNISGEDFAKLVTHHLNIKDPHVIRENPEKSKNIQTSKAYIPLSNGNIQEIDFARARKEIYHDSRIPDVKPASAHEDAMRRDLTINSLFYNINEDKLEDFTGKGVKDLATMTIRTPTNPIKTFKDDPLRIFRVIRFAAKYDGKIDPETYQALLDPSLREEIKNKISKERIGTEFTKMLKNPNPEKALALLKQTNLLQDMFYDALKNTKFEGKMAELDMEQNNPWHELTLWGHTMQVVKNITQKYENAEPETRIVMILSALMHDLGKLYKDIWGDSKSHPGKTSYHGHEKESREIIEHILKYLKMDNLVKQVGSLARYHMQPHSLEKDHSNMKTLRKFIRRMGEQSLNWIDVFNLAMADAMSKSTIIDPKTVESYQNFEKRLEEAYMSLKPISNQIKIQPILNGHEIMQALNIKPGPWMSEITEFVKELRDDNPNITKEEAIIKLQEQFGHMGNPQETQETKEKDIGMSQSYNIRNAKNNSEDDEKLSLCSQQLYESKKEEISKLINQKKYYEAFTVLNDFYKEYGNDEKVSKMTAFNMVKLLSKEPKLKNRDMLIDLFDKAENNYFDTVLCSSVFAILILINTSTEEETIREIGKRMLKMSPGILKTTLSILPEKVYRPKLKQEFIKKINENN